MSSKLSTAIGFIAHYKYLITIVVGIAVVGFLDENSFLQRIKYDIQISQLKGEIEKYDSQTEAANDELRELNHNPRAIEKIARERYFMKADDEDIFVLSTDNAGGSDKLTGTDETAK